MIDENIRIAYFNSIVMKLLNEGKKGWIDFESEISVVIQIRSSALCQSRPAVSLKYTGHIPKDRHKRSHSSTVISTKEKSAVNTALFLNTSIFS